MLNKFLIVASKKDKAGVNITTSLSQYNKFDFSLCEKDILHKENLDLDKISKYDFIIFASKHKSKQKRKTLSVHIPGNWDKAKFGGEKGNVCMASSQFLKQSFEFLNKNARENNLDYDITMECTHHGPLIDKPCMFIEIGSTEKEWKDRKAGFVIAKTIRETIENFKPNPYNENVVAIGGPHYCQSFNKIQLKSNLAISHTIPKYVFPLTKEMIKEAINKTKEEVDLVLLDWKGLGNAESRKNTTKILDELYLRYKKTSQVNKEY